MSLICMHSYVQTKMQYVMLLIAIQVYHDWLIVVGFNNISTLVGHFVSSLREREKKK